MSETKYKKFQEIKKSHKANGTMPDWYTTAACQMFFSKYIYDTDTVKGQFERIAKTAAKHMPSEYVKMANDKFFDMLWSGTLSPSSPVLSNMGTDRALPVSCSGGYCGDSIEEFYDHTKESALLSKHGFGTSGYLGDIRPRGTKFGRNGVAAGVVPVFKQLVQMSRDVSQGSSRRGAYAAYLPICHGDFYELANHIQANPDDANIGWVVYDEFIEKLKAGDPEAIKRNKRFHKLKMVTGKGYIHFHGNVNRQSPQMYKDLGLEVKASNLCDEIQLFSDSENTFTCVLSSMNLLKYDEWKDTDAVYWATIFLDCVAAEFIERGKKINGLEKAVRFTEKGRALGLGVCGFHSYLQHKEIPFESLEAHFVNGEIFKHIQDESLKASQWMAETLGEPEWCKGYGVRNTHRIAIAPTKSCVAPNTRFTLSNGDTMSYTELMDLNDIIVQDGDKKWYDIEPLEIKTPNGTQTVTKLHFNGYEPTLHMIFRNGENEEYELDCTFNHPLRTIEGEWLEAEYIEPEHDFDNGFKLVSSLINEHEVPTFDFEVPDEHCYILESGIVSHNTAILIGNLSEGINPDPAMTFTQLTPAGEIERINGQLVEYMKKNGLYSKKNIQEVIDADGSVQGVDWLSDRIKLVFKTAFEINQEIVLRLASVRQRYICQGQSLNLFFGDDEEEAWISHIHKLAFEDDWVKGLYYVHSKAGVKASKDCVACS